MEGWNQKMDENTMARFQEKVKDLLALAKKKKNVLQFKI